MADGSGMPARVLAPAYRGQHVSTQRPWEDIGPRTRTVLVVAAVAALGATAAVAVLTSTGTGTSRSLPPVPARLSPLPMGQVPNQRPSGPPGYPSAIPTSYSASPMRPPAATRPVPPPAQPSVAPVSYEAESAVNMLFGEARIRAVRGASGGEAIEHIGGAPANALRFNRITVPFDGVYTVAIRYISAGDRSAVVSVDDGRPVTLNFPATDDWQTVGRLTVRIKLDKGANTIRFGNPVDYAPDIDRIVVSA